MAMMFNPNNLVIHVVSLDLDLMLESALTLSITCCSKKGKADHAQMGVGGVLISLTLAVSP